jgi:hypothetical protein
VFWFLNKQTRIQIFEEHWQQIKKILDPGIRKVGTGSNSFFFRTVLTVVFATVVLDTVRLLVEMGDSNGGSSGGGNGGGEGRTEKMLHRDYKPIGRPASSRALRGTGTRL